MALTKIIQRLFTRSNKAFGDVGEGIAEKFLEAAGYTILATNFTCKQGEIDIIARNDQLINFIEVKTRSSTDFGLPEEAVTPSKQRRISRAAKYFLHKHSYQNYSFRADIIAIILPKSGTPEIKHIRNAFSLDQ